MVVVVATHLLELQVLLHLELKMVVKGAVVSRFRGLVILGRLLLMIHMHHVVVVLPEGLGVAVFLTVAVEDQQPMGVLVALIHLLEPPR
jgi:hypothetical protein